MVFSLLAVSIALLIPGLFAPVLTIRGVLTREGVAQMAPMMLERGLNDDTVSTLKSLMNPSMVGMVEALGGDVRKMLIEKLAPQLTAALQKKSRRSKSISRRGASSGRCSGSTKSAARCRRR